MRHISHVTCNLSCVLFHMSPVPCHLCHLSPVTNITSHNHWLCFQFFIFYSVKTQNIYYYRHRLLFETSCASEKVWAEARLIEGPNPKERNLLSC